MAVIISDDKKDLIVSCGCGCEDTFHIKVNFNDGEDYSFLTYMNGSFYRDQRDTIIEVIRKKLKKIWAIIRNKDYYYSDIIMDKEEFNKLKEWINQF